MISYIYIEIKRKIKSMVSLWRINKHNFYNWYTNQLKIKKKKIQ